MEKRDEARRTVSNIDRDLELAKEDGVLTPEIKEKVSGEKSRAEAEAGMHEQRLEDLRSNREHLERKQQEIFGAVSAKCDEKIKVHTEALSRHAFTIEDIQLDLKDEQEQHDEVRAELERFRKRASGLTTESLRPIYAEKIAKLKIQEDASAAAVRGLASELAREKANVKSLETKTKELKRFRDGLLGKKSKESVARAGIKADRGDTRVGDESDDVREAKQEAVEGLSLDDYVHAWNQTHRTLRIDVWHEDDAVVDRDVALQRIEGYLRKTYPRRKKQYEAQLKAFRTNIL